MTPRRIKHSTYCGGTVAGTSAEIRVSLPIVKAVRSKINQCGGLVNYGLRSCPTHLNIWLGCNSLSWDKNIAELIREQIHIANVVFIYGCPESSLIFFLLLWWHNIDRYIYTRACLISASITGMLRPADTKLVLSNKREKCFDFKYLLDYVN